MDMRDFRDSKGWKLVGTNLMEYSGGMRTEQERKHADRTFTNWQRSSHTLSGLELYQERVAAESKYADVIEAKQKKKAKQKKGTVNKKPRKKRGQRAKIAPSV